jgi:hypothetical protein
MGRLLLAAAIACTASGCIDWDSLYSDAPDGGPATGSDARELDAAPDPIGCSDGTAEALLATTGLAACAGAWTVPGVVVETEPTCGRAAGNDGRNAAGEGCSVADLCAPGWHVCRDAGEVAHHGGDTACDRLGPPSPDGSDAFIYLTRQRGTGDLPSCDPDASSDSADDAWGCGTLGLDTAECKPLVRHLAIGADGGGCGEPFDCGSEPRSEGLYVSKREPSFGGGVLCCSDSAP